MIGGIGGGLDPQSMLSRMKEIQASRPDFTQVDKDGSGGVSRGEFRDVFEAKAAEHGIQSGAHASDGIFDKIDVNGDQQLSAQELHAARDRAERMQALLQQFMSGKLGAVQGGSPNTLDPTGEEDEDEFDSLQALLEALDRRDEVEAQQQNSLYQAASEAYRASAPF